MNGIILCRIYEQVFLEIFYMYYFDDSTNTPTKNLGKRLKKGGNIYLFLDKENSLYQNPMRYGTENI